MGKIFCIMGKSAVGKDTIYKELKRRLPYFKTIVLYTTRPIRKGEREGVEYYFRDQEFLERVRESGNLIECRKYHTVCGVWYYFTVHDQQVDLERWNYLVMGTLESYQKLQEYYGKDALVPIYIYVNDQLRWERAYQREKRQENPNFDEMKRRYATDEQDFMEQNLRKCGINKRYENRDLETCIREILRDILPTG